MKSTTEILEQLAEACGFDRYAYWDHKESNQPNTPPPDILMKHIIHALLAFLAEDHGPQLKALAQRIAAGIVFVYVSGEALGRWLHGINDSLARWSSRLHAIPLKGDEHQELISLAKAARPAEPWSKLRDARVPCNNTLRVRRGFQPCTS